MSGFLDALSDPAVQAQLQGFLNGAVQAAQPTRIPLGFGAALGMMGQGALQGKLQGYPAYQQGQIELQKNQLGLDAQKARLAALSGLGSQAGFGAGAPQTPMGFPATRMDAINQAGGAANLGSQPAGMPQPQAPMSPPGDPLAQYFPKGTPPNVLSAARLAVQMQDSEAFNKLVADANKTENIREGGAQVLGGVPVYQQPKTAAPVNPQPFNLAPGATRYDASGKPIVTAPEKPQLPLQPPALLPPDVEAQRIRIARAEASARNDAGGEKFDEPKLIEIDDGQGGTRQLTAQQNKQSGQWVSADEKRTPIDASNIRVVNGSAMPGGGRVAGQVIRITTAAHDIASELENISKLPSGASAGLLPSAGAMGTPMGALSRAVTSQEVQSYKTSSVGISRALAALEAAGLAPPGSLTNQMEGLQLQLGDTELTKMQKMATVRQQAENSIDAILASPLLSKKQQDEVVLLKQRMEKSIPWTPLDVINLLNSRDPKATLGTVAKKAGLDQTAARPAPQGVDPGVWAHMTPQEQALWK